jgi:hypothetical protein
MYRFQQIDIKIEENQLRFERRSKLSKSLIIKVKVINRRTDGIKKNSTIIGK